MYRLGARVGINGRRILIHASKTRIVKTTGHIDGNEFVNGRTTRWLLLRLQVLVLLRVTRRRIGTAANVRVGNCALRQCVHRKVVRRWRTKVVGFVWIERGVQRRRERRCTTAAAAAAKRDRRQRVHMLTLRLWRCVHRTAGCGPDHDAGRGAAEFSSGTHHGRRRSALMSGGK